MKRLSGLLLLFAVAACGGGGGPAAAPYVAPPVIVQAAPDAPTVPAAPIPPAASPPQPVVTADWTVPLSAAAGCGGSPFACTLPPGTTWGLLQPGDVSQFTIQAGALGFSDPTTGMALINAQTLDRTRVLYLREFVRVDQINCDQGVGYVGGVHYGGGADDGDPRGRYRALYISCFAGDTKVRLWLYSPTYAGPIWDYDFRDGQVHQLGIDWYPGDHVNYWLDGAVVFTEGKSFGHDPLDIPANPHPSMWFGSVVGAVLSFEAGYLP